MIRWAYSTESQDASRGSCSDGSVFCLQDLLNNLESDLNVTLSTSFLGGLLSQLGDVSGTDILQVVGGLPTTTACSGKAFCPGSVDLC